MHDLAGGFVLGYHGCDQDVAERLLQGAAFVASDNPWDWLGPGVYFWESNPKRGLDFARELQQRKAASIRSPAVVGAVIALGLCLDTTTKTSLDMLREAHQGLLAMLQEAKAAIPKNSGDLLQRHLDCAVIKYLHDLRAKAGAPAADTVRGVFIEGEPLFAGSGFREKTHVQLAVRNLGCIKGVFRVPQRVLA